MAQPISWRPNDETRNMIDELRQYRNVDIPAVLSMAVAELHRKMQREQAVNEQDKNPWVRYERVWVIGGPLSEDEIEGLED